MPHLVQLAHPQEGRAVARVDDERLALLGGAPSVYDLAFQALDAGMPLAQAVEEAPVAATLDYREVHAGHSQWRLLPAIDHPGEPARCLITGTGLTHLRSAQNRNAMHVAGAAETDSMKMYRWGVEGGRPPEGEIGVPPEWFWKGDGTILRGHGEPLVVPEYGEDGGEEAELAGIYIIDRAGVPRRLGMAAGNEFSDHQVERKNYLYLAHSKLRTCSVGPELVTGGPYDSVTGHVRIWRGDTVLWEKDFLTGELNMCHSLANMEHHHFRSPQHRRPGDVHIHYFGAAAFSSGDGIALTTGDVMEVQFEGYGKSLRNPVVVEAPSRCLVRAVPL